jgi:hypothetical protein
VAHQEATAVGELAACSWSAAASGKADPVTIALTQAGQDRDAAEWRLEVADAPSRAETDPTLVLGEETAMPGIDISAHASAVSASTAELDRWETDGGAWITPRSASSCCSIGTTDRPGRKTHNRARRIVSQARLRCSRIRRPKCGRT